MCIIYVREVGILGIEEQRLKHHASKVLIDTASLGLLSTSQSTLMVRKHQGQMHTACMFKALGLVCNALIDKYNTRADAKERFGIYVTNRYQYASTNDRQAPAMQDKTPYFPKRLCLNLPRTASHLT